MGKRIRVQRQIMGRHTGRLDQPVIYNPNQGQRNRDRLLLLLHNFYTYLEKQKKM